MCRLTELSVKLIDVMSTAVVLLLHLFFLSFFLLSLKGIRDNYNDGDVRGLEVPIFTTLCASAIL